jgi:DNA-binding LytR/AlgR family response regulator
MMPGDMNGVELAHEIRQRRDGLPILLTSGYAQAAKLSADAEGVKILPKPFQLTELSVAIEKPRANAVLRQQPVAGNA